MGIQIFIRDEVYTGRGNGSEGFFEDPAAHDTATYQGVLAHAIPKPERDSADTRVRDEVTR